MCRLSWPPGPALSLALDSWQKTPSAGGAGWERTWLDRCLGFGLRAARAAGLHEMAWDGQAPKMLLTGEQGYPYGQPKRPDGSLATPPLARLVCRNNKASMPPRLALFMNGSFSSAQAPPQSH